jgi:DUF177 domain-containing protein
MAFAFHLEAALEEPIEFDETVEMPAARLGREPLLSLGPLRASGTLARIEEGQYALDGRLCYGGTLECSRCLAEFPFEQKGDFHLVVMKRPRAPEGERELAADDLDVVWYDEPVVLLAPLLEEQIQIALPMKPLCREDCAGLCPVCGRDRNQGACDCAAQMRDPRWDALRALKK